MVERRVAVGAEQGPQRTERCRAAGEVERAHHANRCRGEEEEQEPRVSLAVSTASTPSGDRGIGKSAHGRVGFAIVLRRFQSRMKRNRANSAVPRRVDVSVVDHRFRSEIPEGRSCPIIAAGGSTSVMIPMMRSKLSGCFTHALMSPLNSADRVRSLSAGARRTPRRQPACCSS